ncbi:hypothetical protein ACFYU9_24445 [Streptomyces sp. NPDC004327]|uniref:hypothetical protein n=1 Tax=unclassified Streptomyces TaxID=2593676 RepID=UPI0036A7DE88
MRTMRHRVPVLAAASAAVLLATTGSAQAATGTITFEDTRENIVKPVDGTCYSTQNVNTVGQRKVTNNTDHKLKVFVIAACEDGREAAVLEPGESYYASHTWWPVIAIRRVQIV